MVFGKAVSVLADGRAGRAGRSALFAVVAVLSVTVSSCSSPAHLPEPGASAGSKSSSAPSPTVKDPTVRIAGAATVSYLKPVRMNVADGSFTSVRVNTKAGGQALEGAVSADGKSWVSESPPRPSSSYEATVTVKDSAGEVRNKTVTFKVAKVPDSQRVAFTVTPNDAATVGIGQPIAVRFLTPITRRAAIEKVMLVEAKTPSGQSVTGRWHWLNSQEVHWRPEKFWTPGTKVTLEMKIAGVKAGANRYGRKDYSQTFTIGASHVTRVDASTDRAKVYRDGKLVDNWPTGTGRKGLETYSGTYVVLGKSSVIVMDSCSARITCDKKNPDYYSEKEYWATRVTASGTFLHAASWDGLLGRANTSHGCIHLSDADAEDFYNHAVVGDVVIVSHTGRGPQERIATQDPGLYDWNLSWAKWKAGSAL
jgi:lipoprotein-anchoring transpeptidase ErfK/SrfK